MDQFEQNEQSASSVDIKEYIHLFWSWAWLIVLAGVLAGGAAYFVSKRTTPIYEASTRLLVSAPSAVNGGVDPTALVTAQTMTSTYAEMLLDQPVLQGVIDQLNLQTTPEELKKSITVDVVTNTQLLTITVQDPNPARAADIANAIASTFATRIRELQSQRYSASRDGLAAQVTDMEQQINTTTAQIAAIQQQAAPTPLPTTEPVGKGTPTPLPVPTIAISPADSSALVQLQARLTQYRTLYSNLVTSYEQVRLSEEQTSTNVVVSEPAIVASVPVKPKTLQNTLLAMVAAMMLAAGVVFAADTLDDTIKNPDELRKKFNLPILGMIAWHETIKDKPIALAQPRSPTAEAFRSLRTNLTYAAMDKPLRCILITSPTPEDGKTTIACNLAVVISQGEKQVVLIDADMRRPQVHQKFGLPNRSGLSELFVRPLESIVSVVQPVDIPRLAVITAGNIPPNPVELLTSKIMGRILEKLNQAFELIVIDTPPLLTVTDAAALAPAVDGVIIVVKPGSTKVAALEQALGHLRAVNARILGVVLNDVNPSSRKYGYYYEHYFSKYSNYYDEPESKKKDKKAKSKTEAEPETVGAASPPQAK